MKIWTRKLVRRFVFALVFTFLNVEQSLAFVGSDFDKTIDAKQLAELRDLDALSVSPDGRWAIVQERAPQLETNTIKVRWLLLNLERNGDIQSVFDSGEPIVRKDFISVGTLIAHRPVWSRTSKWFVLTKREGETVELWRGRVGRPELTTLTDIKGVITSFQLSQNDENILFEAKKAPSEALEDLREERENGFLFDWRFVPYVSTSPVADQPYLSPDLPVLAPVEPVSESAHPVVLSLNTGTRSSLILSLATGELAAATPEVLASLQQDNGEQAGLKISSGQRGHRLFSRDGKKIAWKEALEAKHPGVRPLSVLVAASERGERLVCGYIECTGRLENILKARAGDGVIFSRRKNRFEEESSFHLWRPEAGDIDSLLDTTSTISACEYAGNDLICFEESPKSPRRLISIDIASGHIETLFDPNPGFPALDNIKVVRIPITLKGRAVVAAVMAVPAGGSGPLVITSYNCDGFLRGGTGDEYPIFPLVAEGFSVMCLVLPSQSGFAGGAGGNENSGAGVAAEMGFGPGLPHYSLAQEALTEALRQVEARGLAITQKRAITGLSNGAVFAIYALQRGSYAAAITSSGTQSPLFSELGGSYQQELFDFWGRDERFMDEIRPDPMRIETPLLINVSDQELLTSLPTYNALKAHDRAVEMFVYADEAHVKHQPKHRLAIYRRNTQWLKFWLQNEEVDDPVDPEQYARWRKMRDERCKRGDHEKPSYCQVH